MRAHRAWILPAVLVLGLAGVAPAQVQIPSPLPTELQSLRRGLDRAWFEQLPIDVGQERVLKVVENRGLLLALTDLARVIAIDPETGRVLWNVVVGTDIGHERSLTVGTPGVNDTSVFVATDERLYAINRQTGQIRFSLPMPDLPATAAAADNDRAYISMATGRMYVFNLGTRSVEWFIQTNGRIPSPVVPAGDRISFTSTDNLLYVTSNKERVALLRYETDAPVAAPLVIYNQRIAILPSEDYNVYAVNIQTGDTVWQLAMGDPIRRAPALVGDDVYITPDHGGLWRIKARSGQVVWRSPFAAWFLAASRDKVYAMDQYHKLLVLDAATGGVRATWDLHDFTVPVANAATDRVYLATPKGLLIGLHEPQLVQPLEHRQMTTETPLVPRPARETTEFGPIEAPPEPESSTTPETDEETTPKARRGANRNPRPGFGMPGGGTRRRGAGRPRGGFPGAGGGFPGAGGGFPGAGGGMPGQ